MPRATRATPGRIVYVIDASWSMQRPAGGKRRIDLALNFVRGQLDQLRRLCTRGGVTEDRYRIAAIAYSEHVFDLLGGFQPISAVPGDPPPVEAQTSSGAAEAFEFIAQLISSDANHQGPATLVWHITDGSFTDKGTAAAMQRVRALSLDGKAPLIAHLATVDVSQWEAVRTSREWHGVEPGAAGLPEHLRALADSSSAIPDVYRQELRNEGYILHPAAVMLFPARFIDLAQLVVPPTSERPALETENLTPA